MPTEQPTYRIGDVEITRVTERRLQMTPEQLFPAWDGSIAAEQAPTEAAAVARDGSINLSIHSWIVRTPRRLIVIDTATGNHKKRPNAPLFDQLETDYPQRLADAGVDPASVDHVLLTHVHNDHIGFNTQLRAGEWVPMFPNATYVFSAKEHDLWSVDPRRAEAYADSIKPVTDAGLARLIDPADTAPIDDVLHYRATPGHSPDHATIELVSNGERALFGGDLMHHPLQTRLPELNSVFCEQADSAAASRAWALKYAARHGLIWFSSHFADTSVGVVERDGEALSWRFV